MPNVSSKTIFVRFFHSSEIIILIQWQNTSKCNVLFNARVKALNNNLHQFKNTVDRGCWRNVRKKNWEKKGLDTLPKKIRETAKHRQRRESRRWSTHYARTEENVTTVDELVLSQEDQTQTHRSTCQISRQKGLTQCSIVRIVHRDAGLKCRFSFTATLVSYYC